MKKYVFPYGFRLSFTDKKIVSFPAINLSLIKRSSQEEFSFLILVDSGAEITVTQIDLTSIKLEGVSPLRSALEDVATPFVPFVGKKAATDCTTAGADGYLDLTLKFDNQQIAAALGRVTDKEVQVLKLTANLKPEFGDIPIVGEDVIVVLKKK